MTTPDEKINYALSLVDGATPGPMEVELNDRIEAWVIRLGTSVTNHGVYHYVHRPIEIGADHDRPDEYREAAANARQIALSPLIPAALRLALAVDAHGRAAEPPDDLATTEAAVWEALDAFLALLPELPKEARL